MPRFFSNNINNGQIIIEGEDAAHISRSLRMKAGESITVCDLNGTDYTASLLSISDSMVAAKVLSSFPCETEPNLKLALFQALPKGDKTDFIIQKATELGAAEIWFFLSSRCVARPSKDDFAKKLPRLSRIALEAAKQSGRGALPQVRGLLGFDEALAKMAEYESRIIFYEQADEPLSTALGQTPASAAVMVGSEGGFDPAEVEKATVHSVKRATLGKRILRCETAAVAALCCVMYETGNM